MRLRQALPSLGQVPLAPCSRLWPAGRARTRCRRYGLFRLPVRGVVLEPFVLGGAQQIGAPQAGWTTEEVGVTRVTISVRGHCSPPRLRRLVTWTACAVLSTVCHVGGFLSRFGGRII